MNALIFLSNCIIPILLFYIVAYAVLKRISVFDSFLKGAKDGIKVASELVPTMVGLFIGIGILRSGGFLDWISKLLAKAAGFAGITQEILPAQLWPVILTRPFSASAATGLALDLFEAYGPDSFIGLAASLILSCSETILYTMSVYFGSVKITKTRYTLAGGLFSCFAGVAASIIFAHMMK